MSTKSRKAAEGSGKRITSSLFEFSAYKAIIYLERKLFQKILCLMLFFSRQEPLSISTSM